MENTTNITVEELLKEIELDKKEQEEEKEYLESLKKKRQKKAMLIKKSQRKYNLIAKLILLSLIIGTNLAIIKKAIKYYESNKNFFSGRELNISDAELSRLVVSLEKDLNIDLDDNPNSLFLYAILNNDNLTEEEKEILYQYQKMLEDNPFLDKEKVFKALKNVDVEYTIRPDHYKDTVCGDFNYQTDTIRIFQEDKKKGVFTHEGIHCVYMNKETESLPTWFSEGMTQLLNSEYFSEVPYEELTYYPFEVSMVKMLCELIGKSEVLEAFTTGDVSIIVEKISEDLWNKIDMLFLEYERNLKVDIHKYKDVYTSLSTLIGKVLDQEDINKYKQFGRLSNYYCHLLCMTYDSPYLNYLHFIEHTNPSQEIYFNTSAHPLVYTKNS